MARRRPHRARKSRDPRTPSDGIVSPVDLFFDCLWLLPSTVPSWLDAVRTARDTTRIRRDSLAKLDAHSAPSRMRCSRPRTLDVEQLHSSHEN
ncbi:hypothetical protein PUN28_014906 [Cardiocondyla obscurior]|uniref:Uncharacterized protein n=1 Tax=Cardiocondyla obscurior TaxID=286306 RepID=A0AAW2EZX8_9HYME